MPSTLSYALRVLAGRLRVPADRTCPYCRSSGTRVVGSKHLILQLRVCGECGLKYRFPKDTPYYAESFYQNRYTEATVTDLPSRELLAELIANSFTGSGFDKPDKIDFIISQLGAHAGDARVLDYGASFGYFVSQLHSRGVRHVVGYEISRPRALFGVENLGLEILSNIDDVLSHRLAPFDVICTSHVLEHMPRIRDAFEFFGKALKRPGGRLIVWVPNASQAALERFHNGSFAPLVGEPHPLALTYEFFETVLPRHEFRIIETGGPEEEEIRLVAEIR
jgi:SAM-dependent methyltransferase